MNETTIVDKVKKAIDNGIIPGISIAFLNGRQTETYYLGKQGVGSYDVQIDETMQYDLASLSKVVGTTTRILQLIDSQKLAFTTRVQTILQDCSNDCTIEELLLHCAGYTSDIADKYSLNKTELIDKVMKATRVETGTTYSDIGYIILGLIIEKIDQMSLEESFKQHIFIPLKMNQTSYYPISKEKCVPTEYHEKRGMIQGVVHDYKGFVLEQGGSAGLFSTLHDLILFVQHYLEQSPQLFSQNMVRQVRETETGNRTYGWDKKYGKNIYYHTGFTGTSIIMDLEKNQAMIMLTNRIHPTREERGYLELREECNQLFLNQ